MTKAEKTLQIEELKNKFENNPYFYIADSSALSVAQINAFRRMCFEKDVEVKVVKNTLAKKAMESLPSELGFEGLYDSLKGPTTFLFAGTANLPAKLIKEFREKAEKPTLKAAYIESAIYTGDDKISELSELKSKEDLVGDIVLLLQSPIKNVMASLNSGGNTLSGLLKALEERAQN